MNKLPLKKLINERFTKNTRKFFYSFEVTPKNDFEIDISKFSIKPLFVDITWLSDYNLKCNSIFESPAFQLRKKLENSVNVVNSLTCFRLDDNHIDELLSLKGNAKCFTIIRGGTYLLSNLLSGRSLNHVEVSQKYKNASELIKEIRRKSQDDVTIFAACHPDIHPESESFASDMENLKRKVDSGVDVLITQLIFSSTKFCDFVQKCRENGIDIPIIPGLYIPFSYDELKFILKITNVSMPLHLQNEFEKVCDESEKFPSHGLKFMLNMIREIQENSSEHIPGYHFYTMNNTTMLRKLMETINFSEIS